LKSDIIVPDVATKEKTDEQFASSVSEGVEAFALALAFNGDPPLASGTMAIG
jgi:hypothetical protein